MSSIKYPSIRRFIFLFILFLFFCNQAQASSQKNVHDKAKQLNLARHPTWLKLLHYEKGSKQSVVLTDDFFISPNGKNNPEAELTATIDAYFLSWGDNANAHARCRFPARYYWLSKQLDLPEYNLSVDQCQDLKKWALFDSVKSISLLLVSGYLGNPASTFGHALLKLNTDSPDDRSGFFDLTLNYGAMVPEHEGTLLYVIRGFFGGYRAGFSDKYFYTQDIVYSRKEFRDIWDYRLALSDYERTLLILHIWEVVGKKFDYYFLDKNCAFRLAELLELVVDENFVHNGRFWYLPVEMFYRLKDADHVRNGGLIQSVRFVPSSQRVLYHQLRVLTPEELKIFNAVIQGGPDSITNYLIKFTIKEQIVILDALLAYQQYRLISEEPNPSRERQEFKDRILLARLQLPTQEKILPNVKELMSPADGSRPMEFGVSFATERKGKSFLRLNWSPFKQETIGENSLEGDELVVFDTAVGVSEREDKIFLDQLDLVRVLKLNTLPVSIIDESRWSWQLRVGSNRVEDGGKNHYEGVASFGAGRAHQWNELVTGYWMVDVGGHSSVPYLRLRPHLGLRFDLGHMRAWIYSGGESVNYSGKFHEVWGGKMQYQLTDRTSLHAEVTNERSTLMSVGLSLYW